MLNKSHQEMSEQEFTYSSLYHYAKKNPQSANNDYRSSYIKGQKEELKVVEYIIQIVGGIKKG